MKTDDPMVKAAFKHHRQEMTDNIVRQ